MNKPQAVADLLAELQSESIRSDVEIDRTSKAIIYVTDEDAKADDGIELSADECRLVFANPSTIERLVEAINSEDATLALHDMLLPSDSLEAVERGFSAVDEG